MSEQAAQEPTMEEILASIRRIISEDDAPAEGQAEAAAPEPAPVAEAATPEPAPAPQPEPESPALVDETPSVQAADEEVLELTEKVEEPAPVESIGDIDIAPRAEPAPPPPAPEPAPFIAPTPQYQSAVSAAAGGSLDEMVRTIIEAEIKAWLAQNLDQVMREITKEKFDRVFK